MPLGFCTVPERERKDMRWSVGLYYFFRKNKTRLLCFCFWVGDGWNQVPGPSFTVADVARVVGEDKAIRPIHVGEQANIDQVWVKRGVNKTKTGTERTSQTLFDRSIDER